MKGVEKLLMTALTNFCSDLADRGAPFTSTFFKTDNPVLINNAQMLLEWKMSEFEHISNAQSPADFFMHEHDNDVSWQLIPRI